MFSGKQFSVLGLIVGANLLLSLLLSNVGVSLGQQGPTGATGPQGPEGSTGIPGSDGVDGREVEFDVIDNVLVWRYVGDVEWNELDLEVGSGGSTINTGSESSFTHWIYETNPVFQFDYDDRISIENSASYAADLIANEGYSGVGTLEQLIAIGTDDTTQRGKYVLTADIDLSSWTPTGGQYSLIPSTFYGVLDGAGRTLSDLTIDETSSGNEINNGSIFYSLRDATVRNLTLANFDFKTSGNLNYSGALASYIFEGSSKTTIDQVIVSDFKLQANNLYSIGGIVAYNYGNLSIIRSTIGNFEITTNGDIYNVGGLLGYFSGYNTLEMYENGVTMVFKNDEGFNSRSVDYVGGLVGSISNATNAVVYRNDVTFDAAVNENSGGFFGQVSGNSKILIQDGSSNVTFTESNYYNSYNNGGLIGYVGYETLVFINDVSVTGSIIGSYETGGFIGYNEQDSVLKIQNSLVDISLTVDERAGGLVGRNSGNRHRIKIENIEVSVVFYPLIESGYDYSESYNFGGLFGYINDRDDDSTYTTEIWVDNALVMAEFRFEMENPEETQDMDFEVYQLGGLFGEVDQDNRIRVSNTEVHADVYITSLNTTNTTDFDWTLEDVGGVIGYADDGNDLLFMNVDSTLEVNLTLSDFVSQEYIDNTFNNDFNDAGGAVGNLDESKLVIVEGSYEFDLVINISNVDNSTQSYDLEVYSLGGLVGSAASGSFVVTQSTSALLTYDIQFDNNTLGEGYNVEVYVQNFGSLIGYGQGIAFIEDTTYETVRVALVLPEHNGDEYDVFVRSLDGVTGTNNPFVFFL